MPNAPESGSSSRDQHRSGRGAPGRGSSANGRGSSGRGLSANGSTRHSPSTTERDQVVTTHVSRLPLLPTTSSENSPSNSPNLEDLAQADSGMESDRHDDVSGCTGSEIIDRRINLWINGDVLEPDIKVGRSLLGILDSTWFPNAWTWGALTADQKLFYFNEFKKKFRWTCSDADVYNLFYVKLEQRYGDVMFEMRTRKKKPRLTVKPEIWAAWKKKWEEPSYKARCEQNSKNRRKGEDNGSSLATHTSDSRSIYSTKKILTEKHGTEPSVYALYEYTHTRKEARGQQWDEFKEAIEDIQNKQQEQLGEGEEPTPVDEKDVYFKVVKGKKKRRIFGLGTCAKTYFPEEYTSSQPSVTYPPSGDLGSIVNDTVKKVLDEHMKEIEEREQAVRAQEAEFQKRRQDEEIELQQRKHAQEAEFQKRRQDEEIELQQRKQAQEAEFQQRVQAQMEAMWEQFISSKMSQFGLNGGRSGSGSGLSGV